MKKRVIVSILIILVIIFLAGFIYYKYYYPYSGNAPQITEKELECGAYYGQYNQKKPGTPTNWIYISAGKSSYWHSPESSIECLWSD